MHKEKEVKVLKLTEIIVSQKILSAYNHEYLLVGWDFNFELGAYKTMHSLYGINPVLLDGTVTHL